MFGDAPFIQGNNPLKGVNVFGSLEERFILLELAFPFFHLLNRLDLRYVQII